MSANSTGGPAQGPRARAKVRGLIEPWFAPFALVNGAAVGAGATAAGLVIFRSTVGRPRHQPAATPSAG